MLVDLGVVCWHGDLTSALRASCQHMEASWMRTEAPQEEMDSVQREEKIPQQSKPFLQNPGNSFGFPNGKPSWISTRSFIIVRIEKLSEKCLCIRRMVSIHTHTPNTHNTHTLSGRRVLAPAAVLWIIWSDLAEALPATRAGPAETRQELMTFTHTSHINHMLQQSVCLCVCVT